MLYTHCVGCSGSSLMGSSPKELTVELPPPCFWVGECGGAIGSSLTSMLARRLGDCTGELSTSTLIACILCKCIRSFYRIQCNSRSDRSPYRIKCNSSNRSPYRIQCNSRFNRSPYRIKCNSSNRSPYRIQCNSSSNRQQHYTTNISSLHVSIPLYSRGGAFKWEQVRSKCGMVRTKRDRHTSQ